MLKPKPKPRAIKVKPAPKRRQQAPSRPVMRKDTAYVCKLPHYGNLNAPIMIVVDPEVSNRETTKDPLKPDQFKFIARFLNAAGIKREDCCFIAASQPVTRDVWDRDKALGEHLKQHREYLVEAIQRCKPRMIVPAGKCGARQVFGKAVQITKVRGLPTIDPVHNTLVMPILGLLHVMTRPENTDIFKADIETVGRLKRNGYSLENVYGEDIREYEWCTNLAPLIKRLKREKKFTLSVDTEATTYGKRDFPAWYWPETDLLTVQIAWERGKSVIVPIKYKYPGMTVEKRTRLVGQLRTLLEDPQFECSGHNLKYDWMIIMAKLGIEIANYKDDTLLLAHAVDENQQSMSLADMTRIHIPEMSGYSDEFDRDPVHLGKSRMDLVPPDAMLAYGCGDADAAFRLRTALTDVLSKDKKAYACYRKVVMPAMRAFCDVEQTGFPVSVAKLKEFERTLAEHHKAETKRLLRMIPESIKAKYRDNGTGLKLSRPSLLRDYLFTHPKGLRLKARVFTKSTQNLPDDQKVESVSSKEHLVYFKGEHDFIDGYMEWSKNEKMLSTYVKGFYKYIFEGYIRPTYNLHGTVTGRASSRDPNGQNFPKRGKLAKKYREIFQAPPGWVFLEVDYSQIELRLAAIFSQDPNMLKAYREGKDIHTMTAMLVNGLSEKQWNALPHDKQADLRRSAKPVNFGYLYGMWWKKFKSFAFTDYGIKMTDQEAEANRTGFFRGYPALEPWHNSVKNFVKQHGYVRTIDGRVRHLPGVFSPDEGVQKSAERQAINSPVQAFASDLGLMAIARINAEVPRDKLKVLGFIHDACVCLVREEHAMWGAKIVKHYMETNPLEEWFGFKSPIPILADPDIGKSMASMIELAELPGILEDKHCKTWDDVQQRWDDKVARDKALKAGVKPPPSKAKRRIAGVTKQAPKSVRLKKIKPRPTLH